MKYLNTVREVMEAILEGKEVEFKGTETGEWLPLKNLHIPVGNIDDMINYLCRIKPTKPSIDWSHVSEELNYLAIDEDGQGYLFADKPTNQDRNFWVAKNSSNVKAIWFSSFKAGDWDWKDSIVERPKEQ